jgi:hypothetical protein
LTISANTGLWRKASRAWMFDMWISTIGTVRIASASRMP